MRIGQGYDVHKLVEDRDCIICGVKIPYEKDFWDIVTQTWHFTHLQTQFWCGGTRRYRKAFSRHRRKV